MAVADTTFFYAFPEDFQGTAVRLREDEAHHAFRVLRLKTGDEVQVVDGLGGWYRVSLESADRNGALGRILERRLGVGEPQLHLHLAVAAMKSRTRFDMVLEKATELGASRITVVASGRSEWPRVDERRAGRLMRAAMKQCKRSRMPVLEGPIGLTQLVSSVTSPRRIICHDEAGSVPLLDVFEAGDRDVVLIVGPEAGFTRDEVEEALSCGFRAASLGDRRLRTETACIAACSIALMRSD